MLRAFPQAGDSRVGPAADRKWIHRLAPPFGNVDPRTLLALKAGGPALTVTGAPIDRDAVYGQAGFDYRASASLTLAISYSGKDGEHAYDNAVKRSLDYRF